MNKSKIEEIIDRQKIWRGKENVKDVREERKKEKKGMKTETDEKWKRRSSENEQK